MLEGKTGSDGRGCGRAFGIVSVGGEAKADGSRVGLFVGSVELRETGEFSEEEREDPGGHGVERTEMSDGLFSGSSSQAGDDVVRSDPGGFVDDKEPVHPVYSNATRHRTVEARRSDERLNVVRRAFAYQSEKFVARILLLEDANHG